MQHEPEHGRGNSRGQLQLLNFQRVDRDDVVMRLTLGRACTHVTWLAYITAHLKRARRQATAGASCALFELHDTGRDVCQDPVPPSRTGGSIRVEHGDCIAFGLSGRAMPGKLGRLVFTCTSKAAGELCLRESAIFWAPATDREALGVSTGSGENECCGSNEEQRFRFHVVSAAV